MFEIEGKVALVTGGSSGIGEALVIELLNNGAKGVSIAGTNVESGKKVLNELQTRFGVEKVIFVQADVSDKIQFEECFKKTIEKFNNVDILINNAGIANDKEFEKMVSVNVNGTINGTLLAIQNYISKYKSGSEGVIVNVSSGAGVHSNEVVPLYAATKYAVIGLTRSFGTELHYNINNIRIFAICPGITDTPILNSRENILDKRYLENYDKHQHLVIPQPASDVAKNLMKLITTAKHGSVWLLEPQQAPKEVQHVLETEFAKKVCNFFKM
ncbi:hypothetical protein FQA39_LY11396 [Lamprigera yunnana]|nr:hypothetical protein FQA39_LY11396 [Lamprigera yunnana]